MKARASLMDSRAARLLFRLMASVMDSRWRYRFFDPVTTLKAAHVRAGQAVLEVGFGTGFFTIPAARLVGDGGRLYSVDPHPLAVQQVSRKVQAAGLTNVRLIRADAMQACLASGSVDLVLVFGVIPAPVIPEDRLIPEMHRLLRPEGTLGVWTAFPWWSPASIIATGLFLWMGKDKGVHRFRRVSA